MKALLAATLIAASPALAIDVPSGQPVELQEVLIDTVGEATWLRFRFIAPDIARAGGAVDYETAAQDITHLCDSFALPYIADFDLAADGIVISLADRATEFGTADPDATQFFEAFRAEGDVCIWEGL
ncbi:DUF6497 family protein [Marimonas sp. MJW-29]|uniref:DUF6497 family protein n=1 Tax=Sulfitobacter sediminis TaxID=3234186 RepID=A0ABV3RSD1_9RHOB